ncbi:aspartyl/asparaginyl beta-hydroxylase domain-containing protein [Hyphococcus sp. DH-69]|uniref:aspartyl/asparaginyl beta-hydroxylase domain-containing protein n=1 Tax=Hyphococcus formosus TaxID=3143534 RepID=UPI00398B4D90
MSQTRDLNEIGREGMAALRNGDPKTAREKFESIIAAGDRDADTWLAVALARHGMNDYVAAQQALDEVLRQSPKNIRALLLKGDCFMAQGDRRAAASFYNAVVKLVPDPDVFPPEIAKEIYRARAAIEVHQSNMMKHIEESLEKDGVPLSASSARFAESIDFLTEKTRRYVETPRAYYFPDMPPKEFYPRESFDWMDGLEAATGDIANELKAVMDQPSLFAPYIHQEGNRPIRHDHNMLNSNDWSAMFLWRDGVLNEAVAKSFPKTLEALSTVPMEEVPGRAPMVLFSRLAPGAHIEPHSGFLNSRLICHLPIIVPDDCWLRVGNDARQWERGKGWVFNDTIEHEAWNGSDEPRVVLIFSVWRPELTADERKYVASLLQSVDSFAG